MQWIRFGLLMMLLVKTVMGFALLVRRFKGESFAVDGESFEFQVVRGKKRRIQNVRVALALPDTVRFVLRREGAFDTVAKWLGIASEWQTGDESFDRSMYVLCDDPLMLEALGEDADLRAAVLELAHATSDGELRCLSGRLVVDDPLMVRNADQDDSDAEIASSSMRRLRPLLRTIRERLRAIRARAWSDERDPAAVAQFSIVAATTALGIVGIASFFWTEGAGFPRQLVYGRIDLLSALVAAVAGMALLAILARHMWRTSRMHLVLLEILLVGIPGAWFMSRLVFAEINQRFDEAPAFVHEARVLRLDMHRGRRGRRSYYLTIDSWPRQIQERWPDEQFKTRLKIRAATYRSLRRGECARLDLRDGYYGDLWLAGIYPAPCSGEDLSTSRRRAQRGASLAACVTFERCSAPARPS